MWVKLPGTRCFPHDCCFGTVELSSVMGLSLQHQILQAAVGGGTDSWEKQAVQHF